VHQRILVALEVAQQLACVPLKAADAGHVAQRLALRPAAQSGELALAPCPAPVPQAPLRAFQATNRLVRTVRVGRAYAEAAGGLYQATPGTGPSAFSVQAAGLRAP